MPYPLPDEAPYNTGLRWFLVAVPDEGAFVEAALGAYTELGKFYNWGLEGPSKPNSNDAANLFNEAILETLRAWEMGLLDTLIASVDDVETLLQLLIDKPCCDYPAVDYIPGADTVVGVDDSTESTSTTDRDTDTYPGTMTEGQFDTFLCEAAERYVDQLLNWPTKMLNAGQIGMTALLSALILSVAGAFISIGLTAVSIISLSALITWVTRIQAIGELILAGSEDEPSFIETALTLRRSDLICAIYTGPTAAAAAAAIRAIIDDELSAAWADVMGWWPYESTLARVYNYEVDAGGFGGGYGTFDCSGCGAPPLTAGLNLIPLSLVSYNPTGFDLTTTFTDHGDSSFTFYASRETAYKQTGGATVERTAQIGSEWAVTHIGAYAKITAVTGPALTLGTIEGKGLSLSVDTCRALYQTFSGSPTLGEVQVLCGDAVNTSMAAAVSPGTTTDLVNLEFTAGNSFAEFSVTFQLYEIVQLVSV